MRATWRCPTCGVVNEDIPEADTCWQCGTYRLRKRPVSERVRLTYRNNYRRMGLSRWRALQGALSGVL